MEEDTDSLPDLIAGGSGIPLEQVTPEPGEQGAKQDALDTAN